MQVQGLGTDRDLHRRLAALFLLRLKLVLLLVLLEVGAGRALDNEGY